MKASTLTHFQKHFRNTPAVDFKSYLEDENNRYYFYESIETPYIFNLPEGTILLSTGTGSQDAGHYLVKTPQGLYYSVDEDQLEPTLIEDTGSKDYSIDIHSEYYTHTLFSFDVDLEDIMVYLNSHLTNPDFGQMTPVTQEDADKYPVK
jgi:hypothetical protein